MALGSQQQERSRTPPRCAAYTLSEYCSPSQEMPDTRGANVPRTHLKIRLPGFASYPKPAPHMHLKKVRNVPVVSKFTAVWQRAKVKVKSRLLLKYMLEDRILFGANIVSDEETDEQAILSQVMKNRIQAAQKETVVQTERGCLFNPLSPWRVAWGIFYFCLILETAIIMPFRLAFYDSDLSSTWFYIDLLIDTAYFLDILVTFNTPFYNSEGVLETSRRKISIKYIRSWFVLDLISCVPIMAFHSDSDSEYSLSMRLTRLPRLYRLIKIFRVFKLVRQLQQQDYMEYLQDKLYMKSSSVKIAVFVFIAGILIHLMACGWYLTAKVGDPPPDTWVTSKGMLDCSISDLYVASLYWTILTLATVGYGDIHAITTLEMIVSSVWMGFSMLFVSFTVSSVSSLLGAMHSKENLLTTKLAAIDEFAFEAKLNKKLTLRLRNAIRYSAAHQGYSVRLKHSIFSELPRELRYEVSMAMHRGAAKSLTFFTEKDRAFIVAVVPFLNHMFALLLTNIYKERDYADEVYFIVKGSCCLMVTETNAIRKMQRGAYFGEIEVMKRIPRKFTITTNVDTELLTMDKHLLEKVRKDFGAVYRDMEQIATVRDQLNEKARTQFLKLMRRTKVQEGLKESNMSMAPSSSLAPSLNVHVATSSNNSTPRMIVRRGSLRLSVPLIVKTFDAFESFSQLNKRIKSLEDTSRSIEGMIDALIRTVEDRNGSDESEDDEEI